MLPGAGGARTFGGCRSGACSACHRDHPSIAGPQRAVPGSTRWLAGLARDTGILSRRCRTTRRNILPKPALPASYRKTNRTENQSGCLVPPCHTTRSRGRPGRCRASGHPKSCRICPHPPQTLELARSPRLMCPGFPGVGLPDSGHATGWIWLARSSFSTGVSMPGDEWQPRRFRRDRFRRAGRGGRDPAPWLRPRGLPAGKASRIHRGLWAAGRHAGRAGGLTAENLAGSPRQSRCARGHPLAPGDPWTARPACVTGSRGRAGHAAPGRVFAPAALAGRAGEVPAAGQLASHTVSTPRGFRDRLAEASGERGPGHGGARHA